MRRRRGPQTTPPREAHNEHPQRHPDAQPRPRRDPRPLCGGRDEHSQGDLDLHLRPRRGPQMTPPPGSTTNTHSVIPTRNRGLGEAHATPPRRLTTSTHSVIPTRNRALGEAHKRPLHGGSHPTHSVIPTRNRALGEAHKRPSTEGRDEHSQRDLDVHLRPGWRGWRKLVEGSVRVSSRALAEVVEAVSWTSSAALRESAAQRARESTGTFRGDARASRSGRPQRCLSGTQGSPLRAATSVPRVVTMVSSTRGSRARPERTGGGRLEAPRGLSEDLGRGRRGSDLNALSSVAPRHRGDSPRTYTDAPPRGCRRVSQRCPEGGAEEPLGPPRVIVRELRDNP